MQILRSISALAFRSQILGRPTAAPGVHWWREWEAALLVALVAAVYLSRIGTLPIAGEEPRRAQVAFEMQQRGDWIVPREQGDPFLSRPPLQNWLIAASCALCGTRDAWAVRLPSVAAMLLTTLLTYAYGRTFLSRLGALAAAVAFATFGELFQTGRQAETEATFILLLSAALLVWHWGFVCGWPAALMWAAGYVLTALAVLTKGPQPVVYFLGTATLFLILTGQARRLVSAAHLVGLLAGVAMFAAWALPCYLMVGWDNLRDIVLNDSTSRFVAWRFGDVAGHLFRFPFELLGCTLPWSPLLAAYALPEFRRSLGPVRSHVLFLGLAVGLAFPTCWIPPGGQTRFFAPLYPCLALLIGWVVQRVAEAGAALLAVGWRHYLTLLAGVTLLAAAAVAASPLLPLRGPLAAWSAPPALAVVYGAILVMLAGVTWEAGCCTDASQVRVAVLSVAGSMTVLLTCVGTDVRLRRSADTAAAVREVCAKLPPGQRLVSFAHIDALFAYHYGRPIDAHPWPLAADNVPPELAYFCFDSPGVGRPALPFAWEEIAAVSMDRTRSDPPRRVVVVGRRLVQPGSARGPGRFEHAEQEPE